MCETQSLTHPYHRKVGPSCVVGEHHFLRQKVLCERGVGYGSPNPEPLSSCSDRNWVSAVDSVLQCLAVFPALVRGFSVVAF